MKQLSLVVLAAGLGSRFGGPKQLEPIGPGGATLMDYAVYDAVRAGFARVVLVLNPDLPRPDRDALEQRYKGHVEIVSVLQRLEDVPHGRAAGRTKPWGTAHAVLAARSAVTGPFAVVNADDFYGAESYRVVAQFLHEEASDQPATWAVTGYRLADTLSPHGHVNRAVCRADQDGWLRSVEEVKSITRDGDLIRGLRTSGPRILTGDELVSMNCWALTPAVFASLEREMERFVGSSQAATGELLLPDVIELEIRASRARVRVLRAGSAWFGLTHQADRADARQATQRLSQTGEYPAKLWE